MTTTTIFDRKELPNLGPGKTWPPTEFVVMEERWLPVVGSEGSYEVSDQGRVRSLARIVSVAGSWRRGPSVKRFPGKLLTPHCRPDGHLVVDLGRLFRTKRVHILVLAAFVGPRPPGMETLHRNGNPGDNRLVNIHYGTHGDNVRDIKYHAGRKNTKLRPNDVRAIRDLFGLASHKEIGEIFGVHHNTISKIRCGELHADVR